MREMNKGNNYNSTVVNVRGVAVLSVSDGDVTVSPVSPTTNGSAVISAIIHNSGDITANLVNVSCKDLTSGWPNRIGRLQCDSINIDREHGTCHLRLEFEGRFEPTWTYMH